MTCKCGHADECDGESGPLYPLQDGGMCSVIPCRAVPDHCHITLTLPASKVSAPVLVRRMRSSAPLRVTVAPPC